MHNNKSRYSKAKAGHSIFPHNHTRKVLSSIPPVMLFRRGWGLRGLGYFKSAHATLSPISKWITRLVTDLILDGYIYVDSHLDLSHQARACLVFLQAQSTIATKSHRSKPSVYSNIATSCAIQKHPHCGCISNIFPQANYMGMLHFDPNS